MGQAAEREERKEIDGGASVYAGDDERSAFERDDDRGIFSIASSGGARTESN